jgi:hypothetical protein
MRGKILFVLLAYSVALAQSTDNNYTTEANLLNCRGWRNLLTEPTRLAYAAGLINGVTAGLAESGDVNPSAHQSLLKFYPTALTTFDEFSRGIDDFCGHPENAVVPVAWGVQIFALKANGKSTQEIESKAALFRRMASTPQPAPQK